MYPYISALTPAQIPSMHYQARFQPGSMGSYFNWGGSDIPPWEAAQRFATAGQRISGQAKATLMNQNNAYEAAERAISKRMGEIMGGDQAPGAKETQKKSPKQGTKETQHSPYAEPINYWDNVRNIQPGQNTGTGGGSPTIPQA